MGSNIIKWFKMGQDKSKHRNESNTLTSQLLESNPRTEMGGKVSTAKEPPSNVLPIKTEERRTLANEQLSSTATSVHLKGRRHAEGLRTRKGLENSVVDVASMINKIPGQDNQMKNDSRSLAKNVEKAEGPLSSVSGSKMRGLGANGKDSGQTSASSSENRDRNRSQTILEEQSIDATNPRKNQRQGTRMRPSEGGTNKPSVGNVNSRANERPVFHARVPGVVNANHNPTKAKKRLESLKLSGKNKRVGFHAKIPADVVTRFKLQERASRSAEYQSSEANERTGFHARPPAAHDIHRPDRASGKGRDFVKPNNFTRNKGPVIAKSSTHAYSEGRNKRLDRAGHFTRANPKNGKRKPKNRATTKKPHKDEVDYERPDVDYEIFQENQPYDDAEEKDSSDEDASGDEEETAVSDVAAGHVESYHPRRFPSVKLVKENQHEVLGHFDESVVKLEMEMDKFSKMLRGLKGKKKKNQRKAVEMDLMVVEKNWRALTEVRQGFTAHTKGFLNTLQFAVYKERDRDLAWAMQLNLRLEWRFLEKSFPIYQARDEIVWKLKKHQVLVVLADTGSGKSTQLTQFLMQAGYGDEGLIACTEPRKVAATSLATHISSEIGSSLGKEVGFHVGFHRGRTRRTKVVYTTNYTLLKECVKDPDFSEYSCVIVDEAHERRIGADLLLGMLKQCIQKRPEFKVIITSATINPSVFTKYFGGCPVVKIGGRTFPVDVCWGEEGKVPDPMSKYMDESVAKAYEIHKTKPPGDILSFLTAPAEIEDAILKLKEMDTESELEITQLHGRLQYEDQAKVFEPAPEGKRKVVFATIVGETSITIPGIKYVIDCGLVKESVFDPKRNINKVDIHPVSKSSADQRKGRAGRVSPGQCYRLYSKEAYDELRDSSLPEILRVHLGHALLRLLELGILEPLKFDFVESPSKESLEAAMEELIRLGAVDRDASGCHLTSLGLQLVKLPVEPALGKLILLSFDAGIVYEGILLAAVNTNPGSVFYYAGTDEEKAKSDMERVKFCMPEGDMLTGMKVYREWLNAGKQRKWCFDNSVHSKSMKTISSTINEIVHILRKELNYEVNEEFSSFSPTEVYKKLQRLLLICFPQNLSVFTGHHKLGYMLLGSPDQYAGIHGSSALRYLGNLTPKFLVHSQLMKTWRDLMVNVTPIDEDLVEASIKEGILPYDLSNIVTVEECGKVGPYGDMILRKCLNRYVIEREECRMRKELETQFIVIDSDLETGEATFFLPRDCHEEAQVYIAEINQRLEREKEAMKNKVVYHNLETVDEKTLMRVALTAGLEAFEILNPGEFIEVMAKEARGRFEDIANCFKSFGNLLKTYCRRAGQSFALVAVYKDTDAARNCVTNINSRSRYLGGFSSIYRAMPLYKSENHQQQNHCSISVSLAGPMKSLGYDIVDSPDEEHVTITHKGFGFLRCLKSSDVSVVIRALKEKGKQDLEALKDPEKKIVNVSGANNCAVDIYIGNLSKTMHEAEIKETLMNILVKENIKVRRFQLVKLHKPIRVELTPKPKINVEQKLYEILEGFNIRNYRIGGLKEEKKQWKCVLTFSQVEDGDDALKKLKTGSLPKGMTFKGEVLSSMFCSPGVFKTIKTPLQDLQSHLKAAAVLHGDVEFQTMESQENEKDHVKIEVKTETRELNLTTRFLIRELLQGETVDFGKHEAAQCLFTETGVAFLKKLGEETKTSIQPEASRTSVVLYGSEQSRCLVREKINSYLDDMGEEGKIMLYEKDVNEPGLIRILVNQFGTDFKTLIDQTSATKIYYNVKTQKLVVYSTKDQFEQVSNLVEEAAKTSTNTESSVQKVEKEAHVCPVCFCEVEGRGFRLQYCMHVYCQVCIRMQLQNDLVIPLTCCYENCGEPLVFDDILPLIPQHSPLSEKIIRESVKVLMGQNSKKYFYCPYPDCKMIFKKSVKTRYTCPSCSNDVCLRCKVAFHEGEPCDEDKMTEDESVQAWLKKNPENRKICGNCSTLVEKLSGCNRMQCVRCRAIFCWRCLKVFPSDVEYCNHQSACRVETVLARIPSTSATRPRMI